LPATIGSNVLDVLGVTLPREARSSAEGETPFTVPFDPFNGEPTSATLKAVLWVIDAFLQTSRTVLPMTGIRSVASVVSAAIVKSNESGGSLEIIDVCLLCVGYLSIFGAIYLMFQLSQLVDKVAGFSRSVSAAIEPVKSLARVAKVFVLLYLRIFILPMCLGACVLSSTNVLLQLPRDVWITFIASNIVGSIALTWVLGITYMLTVTLSVLQLREVLHPDVLAKNTRPQEAHLDLLSSLLMDTGVNHVRRMCVSMVVYIVLMAFLVVAPIWIARYAAKILNLTHLLTVRTWYFLPEIQLPFELASGHIAFLT
jgi:E3 ubiquitin-protein ligase MARCH6